MNISELSTEELNKEYGYLLCEIKNKLGTKQEFENEFIRRFREGKDNVNDSER